MHNTTKELVEVFPYGQQLFLFALKSCANKCLCVCVHVSGGGGGQRGCLCPCASVCLVSVRVCMHACKCACVCLWCVCAQRFYTCWIPSVKNKTNKQQPKTNNKTVCWVLQNYAYLWANVYYSISISTDTACLKTAPWLSWLCKKKVVGGTLLLFSFTPSAIYTPK